MKYHKYNLDKYYQERDYLNFADYLVDQIKQIDDSIIESAKLQDFSNMVYKEDRKDLLLDLHYLSRKGEWRLSDTKRDINYYNLKADEAFIWLFKHWWV